MNELEISQVPILDIDKSALCKSHIELHDLLNIVAATLKVHPSWLVKNARYDYLVDARQLYCYFATKITDYTPSKIGRLINRHRTTVIHSIQQVERLLEVKDALMHEKYLLIKKALNV